jgi:adenylate cyclase
MRYKGTDKSIPEIARELNVDGIVEGSVRRAGDRVRITAQLIRAATDEHVWAESYERNLSDILALQSEVARAIAGEIQIKLTPQERARLIATRKVVPEAYEFYLRGLQEHALFSPRGFTKGVDYFEKSIQEDPDYAPSHAALAESLCWLPMWSPVPPGSMFPKAAMAASKALQLDSLLAEAHAALAHVKAMYERDWLGAEREFRQAIELNPSSASARYLFALFLANLNRFHEAIPEAVAAKTLDPGSAAVAAYLALVYYQGHKFEDSIAQYQKVVSLDPENSLHYAILATAFALTDMRANALAAIERARALVPPGRNVGTDAYLACACGLLGMPDEIPKWIENWEHQAIEGYVDGVLMAPLYIHSGNIDRAFECYNRALRENSPGLIWIERSPIISEQVRSDPRWHDLMRRVGFSR